MSDGRYYDTTAVATVPGDSSRVIAVTRSFIIGMVPWLSTDGGATWHREDLPTTLDVAAGQSTRSTGFICCDPSATADAAGDLWVAGVAWAQADPAATGPVVINRIASGETDFQAKSVALPANNDGQQGNPQITIDNTHTSPTFGRLFAVWIEPAADDLVNIVLSHCDTEQLGVAHPELCDQASNWSTPSDVTGQAGSYYFDDIAVGPDGQLYVTWWNYSSANAIEGASCDPSSADCSDPANWSGPQTIALLDDSGGAPIPAYCALLAQPNGNANPDPTVTVDDSGGPNNGRVYVTWGDLRAGSGTTRCHFNSDDTLADPSASDLTWDAFVASAFGIPGGNAHSSAVGRRLLTDGEKDGAANSDDWLAGAAVDQATGRLWAGFYSTRDDPSRLFAGYYVRSVTPSGNGLQLGQLQEVSATESNLSADPDQWADYGEYSALDATGDSVYPAWIERPIPGGDGGASAFSFDGQLSDDPAPPESVTGAAVAKTSSSYALTGTVNPNGLPASAHIEWGTTTAYGLSAPTGSLAADTVDHAVSATVEGLALGTTYHYRVVANSSAGTDHGADLTFTTPPAPPAAQPLVVTPKPGTAPPHLAALHVRRRQNLRLVLRRGLSGSAKCSSTCTVRIEVVVAPHVARRLGLTRRLRHTPVAIGRLRLKLSPSRRFFVHLSHRAAVRFATLTRVRVELQLTVNGIAASPANVRRVRIVLDR